MHNNSNYYFSCFALIWAVCCVQRLSGRWNLCEFSLRGAVSCSYIRGSGQLSVSLLTVNVRWSYSAAPATLWRATEQKHFDFMSLRQNNYKKPSCLEKGGQGGNRRGFLHCYLHRAAFFTSEVPVISLRCYFSLHPLNLGLKSFVNKVNI